MKTVTRDSKLDDPMPAEFRQQPRYTDHVTSTIIKYCSNTSKNITMRYLWDKRMHGPILSANFEYLGIMIFRSAFHAAVSRYLQCSCIQLFHT